MNAARLGRLLEEAGEDRTKWAEAIYDEVTDPAAGLVTRDYLDKRFAEHESSILRTLVWTQIGGFLGLAVLILFKL